MQVPTRHARWVRATHGAAALSVVVLACSGGVILMAHPRLYWGEVGNDLTPALLELPISRNHRHDGWTTPTSIAPGDTASAGAPVSASRTFEIFNQNGWGRSLHFLAGWVLVATGLLYLTLGAVSGHLRRALLPRRDEVTRRQVAREIGDHLRLRIRAATGGPDYGLLQKSAYACIVFVALPLTAITGLTMSPAVTAAAPFLLTLFGGLQSARTIHFALWALLLLFTLGHITMVVLSGFRRQIRAMTVGE